MRPYGEVFDQEDVIPDRCIFPFDGSLDIKGFLQSRESPLASVMFGTTSIGAAIKASCSTWDVRPEFVLVSLQTEQRLIEWYKSHVKPPTQDVLDWALGFGKLDDGKTVERFKGLEKQIQSCAQGVRRILRKVTPFVGKPYTLDAAQQAERVTLTCKTAATLVLYEYTPHIEAARLRWQLYRRYFPGLLTA